MSNDTIKQVLREIHERLGTILEDGNVSNGKIDWRTVRVPVPKEPRFRGKWQPREDYILDEKGRKLIEVAKEHLASHGALPPISMICRQAGLPYHEYTNRFQSRNNFLYYLRNEAS